VRGNPFMTPIEAAIAYHQRTKHHFNRFARALGYMDWATQPDPFRRFEGAPRTLLPLSDTDDSPPYEDLYRPGTIEPAPVTIATVSAFLERALGLTAWKEYRGTRWALRANPSSGNLHPTEGYVITAPDSTATSARFLPRRGARRRYWALR